jgi:PAS domain S-box-containing protein
MFRENKFIDKVTPFKLKYRLIYPLTFFILLFSVSFYKFFTGSFESQAIKSLEDRANFVSQYIAEEMPDNYSQLDTRPFDKKIISLFNDYKIEYLVLFDGKGLVEKTYNFKKAEKNNYILTQEGNQLTPDKKIFRTETRVVLNNSSAAKAYVGFSAEDYLQYINSKKKETGIISLILFFGCTFILFIISSLTTIPLRRLTKGSEKFIKGDLSHKINYFRNDQLGIITKALNYLALNLDSSNKKVESLDRQLKVIFRDKIGELNIEVNQRRIAQHSLKQSEKQFRLLFEKAPIGMVISSPDDVIMQVNSAFCQSLGYSKEELIDKKTSQFTYLDDQPGYIKLHNQLLEENLSHIYFENRFIRKDKKVIYTIVESVLVRGEEEKPHHYISQVIDITERKNVEKELVQAKEKAEESDRLKSAFLAQMSHEIRTPLNVIIAATPILADELPPGNEENDALVDSITNAGKRLQRTIDMILNMSSVQSGNYIPEIEEVDLNKELRNLTEEFKQIMVNKNLELKYYNNITEPFIIADKYTVIQIFQNLIGNAIKYTQKGEIVINLFEQDKQNICVEVRDTGIGMSPEYLKKLFTPFSQEDTGHKRNFEGNGLGLALVKKYVELNNAEISVKSIKDKGSIFAVAFKSILWHRMNSENKYHSSAAL